MIDRSNSACLLLSLYLVWSIAFGCIALFFALVFHTQLTISLYYLFALSLLRYYGTRDFPHPSIGLPYDEKSDRNFPSYAGFEAVAWSSMDHAINVWRRKTLDLPIVSFGMGASTLIPDAGVSFSAMWSPSFVPKPEE